jgi:tetratricopeptide (TPR) repeat protein/tRNA A-37 threonylcarbamoyl transferase component Bud32
MTDEARDIQDIRRFSEGRCDDYGFSGLEDYGLRNIEWSSMTLLYMLNMERKGEKNGTPFLLFTDCDTSYIFSISARQFNYRKFFGEQAAREHSADDLFRMLVEKFVAMAQDAYCDLSVRDFLRGGSSFLPKAENIRAFIKQRELVAQRAMEAPIEEPEMEEQKIGLKVWEPGEVIDEQFEVQNVFKGGMGVVYIVSDVKSSQMYAVKMFQEQFLYNRQVSDMFLHEAQVWIELEKHENIVQANFVRTFQGCPALFLEYVDGSDLEAKISEGALDVELALDLALQFCAGMSYAYEKLGIVHRDIKPSNCLIDSNWVLKITDFGLVTAFKDNDDAGASLQGSRNNPAAADADESTQGTFAYMAPECFKSGARVDTRSDIYSFGIMFYEMLTGSRPIPGNNVMEYMRHHAECIPLPPCQLNSAVSRELSDIVLRCLEKDPAKRFPTFRELRDVILLIFRSHTGFDYLPEKEAAEMTAEEWTNKALSLAALGRHEDAVRAFDDGIIKAPRNADLWAKKGDSLAALGSMKDAIKCYDKSLILNHRKPETWVSKGNVLFLLNDYEKAMFCFNNALKVDPDNADVWIKKAIYYNLICAPQEAIECIERALRINAKSAEAWYTRAQAHEALGQYQEAVQCTLRALEENPLWGDVWHLQAMLHSQLGDHESAIESYNKVIEMNPQKVDALLGKARSLFLICRFNESLEQIAAVLKVDGTNLEALELKGDSLFHLKDKEEALSCYEQILSRSPRHASALLKKGHILLELMHFEEARVCYDGALIARPGDATISYYRETIQKNIDLLAMALAADAESLDNHVRAFLEDADLSHMQQEGGKGGGILSIFRKKEKETPEQLRESGREAFNNRDYQNAVQLLARYLSQTPDDGEMWRLAGEALLELGSNERALACFKKAAQLIADEPEIWRKMLFLSRGNTVTMKDRLICLQKLISWERENMSLRLEELSVLEELGLSRMLKLKALELLKMLSARAEKSHSLRDEGALLTILGRYRDAVKAFDGALKKDQKDVLALIQKGDVLSRTGEKQVALKSFMMASRFRPNDARIFYFQGMTYEDLNDYEKAMKCYDLALKSAADFEPPLISKGFLLYKGGQLQESLEYYNRVLENNPYSFNAWQAKGLVMAMQKRYDEAKWCFDRALEVEKTHLSTLKNKALLLIKMEQYEDARDLLEMILLLDSLNEDTLNMKAIAHFRLGELDTALLCAESSLEILPRYAHAWVTKGFILSHLERHREALESFDRALEIDYTVPEAFLNRGVSLCRLGRDGEALTDYRVAGGLAPKSAPVWFNLGLWYAGKKKYEDALSYFDRAISCEESLVEAWIERTLIKLDLKLYDEALALAEKATKINGKNYRAWFVQGYAMILKDSLESQRMAIKSFDKCLRLKPDYIPALIARGETLQKIERGSEADENLEKARTLIMERRRAGGTESASYEIDFREEFDAPRLTSLPMVIYSRYFFAVRAKKQAILFEAADDRQAGEGA